MTESPEPDAKPKPPRKSKAEREAERQAKLKAEADKPLTAGFWGLLAGFMLVLTGCFYIDVLSLANYQSQSNNSNSMTGEFVVFVLAIIYMLLGRTWGTVIFGFIGLFCLYKSVQRRWQIGSWDQ